MNLQFFAHLFTERMLGSLLGGMILALVAWLALRLIGRQNSRTRFAVWFATLLGIAALPFLDRWEAAAGIVRDSAPLLRLPESWAIYFVITWATAASYGLARIAVGLWQVRQLRKTCRSVDPQTLEASLNRAIAEFPGARPAALCVSDSVRVPTAIGFGRPAVVLPAWCLQDLNSEELHAVVLHELQHLRRRDDWTNLLQQVVGALFFFHPAVWWLEERLALEREMACDDAVIAATENRRAYARCLVSLAEKSYVRRGLAMAPSRCQPCAANDRPRYPDPRRRSPGEHHVLEAGSLHCGHRNRGGRSIGLGSAATSSISDHCSGCAGRAPGFGLRAAGECLVARDCS